RVLERRGGNLLLELAAVEPVLRSDLRVLDTNLRPTLKLRDCALGAGGELRLPPLGLLLLLLELFERLVVAVVLRERLLRLLMAVVLRCDLLLELLLLEVDLRLLVLALLRQLLHQVIDVRLVVPVRGYGSSVSAILRRRRPAPTLAPIGVGGS